MLERRLKLGSGHLVDGSVVLELAEDVAVLNAWTRTRRKGLALHLLLANHLKGREISSLLKNWLVRGGGEKRNKSHC